MPQESATLTDPAPASESAIAPLGPVQQEERYVLMDVVRGFALFGVLAANMRSFNLPLTVYEQTEKFFSGHVDVWAQAILSIFISAKFYSLFAFLFGLGFAIQISRAQSRSDKFPKFYLRRLAALMGFGIIHGILIWNGDILFAYSFGGFLLFWFRKARLKTVGIWACSLWGLGAVIILGQWIAQRFHLNIHLGDNSGPGPDLNRARGIIAVYAHSHLLGTIHETALQYFGGHFPSRAHPFAWFTHGGLLLQNLILGAFSMAFFLLGLWVWRKGVLQDLPRFRPSLARVCAWTLPLGLALNAFTEIHYHIAGPLPPHQRPSVTNLLADLSGTYGVLLLACGYATALAVLFTSDRWRGKVAWLAPVGRMALTNYLTQSIVCTAFYSGIITGLYGRVGPAWDWVATIVLYTAQVFFSHWWLARYRFGPMEWLWRSLTYGKRPAMRLAA